MSPTPKAGTGTDGANACAICAVPKIAKAPFSESAAQLSSPDIVPASGPRLRVAK